jgi:PucR C-terminal helix-turn-helix domain/GGDEF-like domain
VATGTHIHERSPVLFAAIAARRAEIGDAVLARVQAIGGRRQAADPEYLEGLRLAVDVAIDHTIEASRRGGEWPLAIPDEVLGQARLAARRRVPLETVLRRYLAGHSVLADYMAEEAARLQMSPSELRYVLRSSAAETDRMLAEICSAYDSALNTPRFPSGEQRRAQWVRRLLAGELLDLSGLEYDLDRFHVGIVIRGSGAEQAVADLVGTLGATRLWIVGDDELFWAWIGRHERPDVDRIRASLVASTGPDLRVGIGEASPAGSGWRLTHQQARAALSVADRSETQVARYADVALLASAMKDELLTTSLQALYLDPLEEDRADGKVLQDTLHAYLDADRSTTSAAAALGVTRNTVTNRIRAVEARIGHLRPTLIGDIALALRLAELRQPPRPT